MNINSQNGPFEALEWSSSAKVIWTGHNDGTVARRDLIWGSSRLVKIARKRIVRELPADERSDFGLPQIHIDNNNCSRIRLGRVPFNRCLNMLYCLVPA